MATKKPKKLKLSQNKMLAGVCAGFAEFLEVDVTMVRVLFACFVILTGFFPGVLGYLVAWFIMASEQSKP